LFFGCCGEEQAAAHTGKPGLPGFLAAGQFPREIAVEPGGLRLLVTNCISGQLETVSLPG
jgi:hypothetical protein